MDIQAEKDKKDKEFDNRSQLDAQDAGNQDNEGKEDSIVWS